MVKTIMFSSTGYLFGQPKRTTPHDFRRIAITWQRQYGRVEDKTGLAEIMGHSVVQADLDYDQATSGQKTESASEWWNPTRSPLPPLEAA
jgi:integrase